MAAVPDARVELQIAGTWVDVTDDVDKSAGISHSRGRRAEGSRVDPAAASLTLRNDSNAYSNRAPTSTNYGKLGRNTPMRISVGGADTVFEIPERTISYASTPDHASLDITGDLDVRVDVAPALWAGGHANAQYELISKYLTTGNQRGWLLGVNEYGGLRFWWSSNGSTFTQIDSTVSTFFGPNTRGAVRVTLDVNNGLGGYTQTFYTAPTMAGPWTQLGDATVTTSGTTSIFSNTAVLAVGDRTTTAFQNTARRYYSAEVRSGIGGSVVANPNFNAQAPGTTSFTDGAGRTWTNNTGTLITDRRNRGVLEVSEWTPDWHSSGHGVTVPVRGAGILRRLGQGAKELASTLRRRIPPVGLPKAYWPLEEGRDATQAYSPVSGVAPLSVSGFDFASDDTMPGASALPRLTAASRFSGTVPAYTPTGQWLISAVYLWPTAPASNTLLLDFTTTGSARRIAVTVQPTSVLLEGFDAGGGLLFSTAVATAGFSFHGPWNRLEISAIESGANCTFRIAWVDVDGTPWENTQVVAATAGIVQAITTTCGALAAGTSLGHLGVFDTANTSVYEFADNGWRLEDAGTRAYRLGIEENVPITLAGYWADMVRMGPQRPNTLLTLLGEVEAADGGILSEATDFVGLTYRGRPALYNQTPRLTIPYGQLAPSLELTDDDRHIRNDRTVSRVGGSSARAVQTTGALSTAAPPAGVGIYDDSQTVNVGTDAQCADVAGWLLRLGTWDEPRVPKVRLYVHKDPSLVQAITSLTVGDVIRITDLPSWLPPGPLDLIVEGWDEKILPLSWEITLNCSPAGPWTVPVLDDTTRARLDTSGSTLASGISSSATSLSVATTTGPLWSTVSGHRPFNILVGGELMTVTGLSGASSPQTFTVTRSVNGVVKAHSSAAPVRLAQAVILAL
ncbi:hypothetical protein [Streptomyces sp. NBC_01565]|uniref:hypothetical protein n=1 Tax=Streptomyces sp. NBC_01565 TaxID=2975881 RepID=UPI002256CF3C|nr:hypothetical protein [Streptomyces sp. NBC_01565]MCX4540503.1 hypothetical protein [Streptomyces sp. NBC_01565]